MIRCRQILPNLELSVIAMTTPRGLDHLAIEHGLGFVVGGDAALQVEAVHAQEQLVHVQRAERFHGQAAVERHALAAQLATQHDDVDVALGGERGEHAEVVA